MESFNGFDFSFVVIRRGITVETRNCHLTQLYQRFLDAVRLTENIPAILESFIKLFDIFS